MEDKWIDNIRDKMADYDVVPPAGLLDAVEAKVRVRRMRRRVIFGGIAASVALIGGLSLALIPDMPDTSLRPLVSDGVGVDSGKGGEEFINNIDETMLVAKQVPAKPKSRRGVQPTNMNAPTTSLEEEDKADEEMVYKQPHTEVEPYRPSANSDDDPYYKNITAVQTKDLRSDSHSPLSVGVSTSANGLGGVLGEKDIEVGPLLASATIPQTRMGGGMLYSPNADNRPEPTFVEMFDHRLPVRASVDLSWRIGYNLNIGTGLTYSYLRSDIRYGYSDSPLFKAAQNLHFIGIPVNVRYTPWSFRKLDIYASAGFMAEKCIGGGIKTENAQDPGYSYAGCNDRPFQFSFNAAAGLQYSFAGNCSVFVEPGIGLYLKNVSRLRTIYSERPVTFNVNVGFRFGH